MREAHVHIASFGESLSLPSLCDCRSLDECLERVRAVHASTPAPGWVRLTGARPEAWRDARWPTRGELDLASPDHPCVLMSFDHHAACANSLALHAAKLRAGDRVGAHGEVRRDPTTGEASGMVLEDAAYALWKAAPEPTIEEREQFVRASVDRFAALGFDEVHDLLSQDWLGPTLARLEARGELPVRAWLYPLVDRLPAMHAGSKAWTSDRVRLAGGKLFADGTLNSRTALMLAPYRQPLDPDSVCGRMMATPGQIEDAVGVCETLGGHLAVHAIGDGAVRLVLDAIEHASERTRRGGAIAHENRHRIEHCELIDAQDVPRFARLGVVCSVQPCHLLTDIEVLRGQLSHRLDRVLPLRELIDSGCTPAGPKRDGLLWFGSDAPIVRPEPEDSIQAAVKRRRSDMSAGAAIAIEQRINESEAWSCFGVDGPPPRAQSSSTSARHTKKEAP